MDNVQIDLTELFVAKVEEFKLSSVYGYSTQAERSFYVLGMFKAFLACMQSSEHIDNLVFQHSLMQDQVCVGFRAKAV